MRGAVVRESKWLAALSLALGVAGCQPSAGTTILPSGNEPGAASLANDFVVDRSSPPLVGVNRQELTVGDGPQGEQILYLNFDGATIKRVDKTVNDDSSLNTSAIVDTVNVGSTIAFPAFDSTPYAPDYTDATARQHIVDLVKDWYAPYNVFIVTTRPAAGARYTMLMVGGSVGTFLMSPGAAVGIAPLDCDNQRQVNIGFSFAVSVTQGMPATTKMQRDSRLFAVAMTVAHEAGHTFGLEHVNNMTDIMTASVSLNVTGFLASQNPLTEGNATCGSGTTESTDVRLKSNLGTAPSGPVLPKPIITLLSPKNGETVPRTFTISVDVQQPANAGGTITKVEFQQAGATLATAIAPPYRHTFISNTDGPIVLSAVAYNSLGGKASVQTEFTVMNGTAEKPIPCLATNNCDFQEVCQGGVCIPGPITPTCVPACGADQTCQDDGTCSAASTLDMADPVTPTAAVGSVCSDSSQCGTGGVCASSSGKQYCTVMCEAMSATSCPSGFRCSAVGSDHFCSPAPSGCQASAWSGSSMVAFTGVAVTGLWPWLALVALWSLLRARRRPSAT